MVYTLSKASILVVDDMQPMLAIISSILKIFGFTNIHLAHDAQEGLDLFCQHNPDIVLTDWLMEPFDGVELARRIRAEETRSPNRFVPIIMMTGYSHRVRVEQARVGTLDAPRVAEPQLPPLGVGGPLYLAGAVLLGIFSFDLGFATWGLVPAAQGQGIADVFGSFRGFRSQRNIAMPPMPKRSQPSRKTGRTSASGFVRAT